MQYQDIDNWLITNPEYSTEDRELVMKAISQFNAVRERQSLHLTFSESDLQELQDGDEFNWCFHTDRGEPIDITLVRDDDEMEDKG